MPHHVMFGNQSIDTGLIGYVDLEYRAPAGSSRVMIAMAASQEERAKGNFQRLFFADREAEQLRSLFRNPQTRPSGLLIFPQ